MLTHWSYVFLALTHQSHQCSLYPQADGMDQALSGLMLACTGMAINELTNFYLWGIWGQILRLRTRFTKDFRLENRTPQRLIYSANLSLRSSSLWILIRTLAVLLVVEVLSLWWYHCGLLNWYNIYIYIFQIHTGNLQHLCVTSLGGVNGTIDLVNFKWGKPTPIVYHQRPIPCVNYWSPWLPLTPCVLGVAYIAAWLLCLYC